MRNTTHTTSINIYLVARSLMMAMRNLIIMLLALTSLLAQAEGWQSGPSLNTARSRHTATLLPDGQVLVVGGFNTVLQASAELYNPDTNTWSSAGSLATARRHHTATLLTSGKVLVVGGGDGTNFLASAELHDRRAQFPAGPPCLHGTTTSRRA